MHSSLTNHVLEMTEWRLYKDKQDERHKEGKAALRFFSKGSILRNNGDPCDHKNDTNVQRRTQLHTSAESVDILIKLESDDRAIMVNDVRLAVPGTRHYLFSAITLNTNIHICSYLQQTITQVSSVSPNMFYVFGDLDTRLSRLMKTSINRFDNLELCWPTDRDVQFL